MQVLYALNRDKELSYQGALKAYRQSIRRAYDAYLYGLLLIGRTADYARIVKKKKLEKLRPTEADRTFSSKFATNDMTVALLTDDEFNRQLASRALLDKTDAETVRSLYHSFGKTEIYQAYLRNSKTTPADDRQILLDLFKHLLQNELFHAKLDDLFPNWIDDDGHVNSAIKKTLKALPEPTATIQAQLPGHETVVEFGETLLHSVFHNDEALAALIEPTLRNWDADRVAVMDMILLKMALTELRTFETIPPKVTMNEFVEVSKQYSTDKSKDFINGVLDRLLKQLTEDGKIEKRGRGLLS